MSMIKENLNGLLLCMFEVLVGVLLLINPVGFTSGIIITLGIALLLIGLMYVVQYLRMKPQEAVMSRALFKGLVCLVIGAFCVMKSQWFVETFPLLTLIYGIIILMTGLYKVQWTVDMLRMKKDKWYLIALSALISLVCGGVILYSPFEATITLWKFTAISLIVEAIFDIVTLVWNGKKKQELETVAVIEEKTE